MTVHLLTVYLHWVVKCSSFSLSSAQMHVHRAGPAQPMQYSQNTMKVGSPGSAVYGILGTLDKTTGMIITFDEY